MGYMRHNAIVITSYDKELIAKAHAEAEKLVNIEPSPSCKKVNLVSPIMESVVNSYWTFFISPDGSKEGWETSDVGEAGRAAFIAWMKGTRFTDNSSPIAWALIQYGDDNGHTLIVDHSDAMLRSLAIMAFIKL